MRVGYADQNAPDIGLTKIRHWTTFKYLGITFSSYGRCIYDTANKIGQGIRVIETTNLLTEMK